jgi:hypothetical protein
LVESFLLRHVLLRPKLLLFGLADFCTLDSLLVILSDISLLHFIQQHRRKFTVTDPSIPDSSFRITSSG